MGSSCSKNGKIIPTKPYNCVLKWESRRKTEQFHWWPMCDTNENDTTNNLYADGNALSKYDTLFDTHSVKYQKKCHYISKDSNRTDKSWAGFCNYAAIMSSLYSYPRYPVTIKHKNKLITFSVSDIEQLIIIACNNAIKPNISFFFGKRNNDSDYSNNDNVNNDNVNNDNVNKNKEEPLPSDLLNMLEIMCKNDRPFIMDIDNGEQVWNYAYDKVEVNIHKKCPLEHSVPQKGDNIYYNFKITSSAYPDENQDLWGYENTLYNEDGYICKKREKWISETHPDFVWGKYPIEKPWEGKCDINPKVDSRIVYEIYKISLNSYSNTLIIN